MKRAERKIKTNDSEDAYKVVEWRIVAVWNDGLVEDWSKGLAKDSTLAMEVETYCVDYEELRNIALEDDEEEYNATEW